MKLVDLTGKKLGAWSVLARAANTKKVTAWSCACECGRIETVRAGHLVSGRSTRCRVCAARLPRKHGAARGNSFSAEYKSWRSMRARVLNPRNKSYAYYGGKGVRICDRWGSFENFLSDMGPKPTAGHSLDRVNSMGHYEPDNCRWATRQQQVEALPQNQKGYKQRNRQAPSSARKVP